MSAIALNSGVRQLIRLVSEVPANGSDQRHSITSKSDFLFYARNCLHIRPKPAALQPFVLNEIQTLIHRRLLGISDYRPV